MMVMVWGAESVNDGLFPRFYIAQDLSSKYEGFISRPQLWRCLPMGSGDAGAMEREVGQLSVNYPVTSG